MTLRTSVLVALAITMLVFGVGAIPAVAGTGDASAHPWTALVRAIDSDQPALKEVVSSSRASLHGRDAALGRIARSVAGVHADRAQRAAQRDWVAGVRCEQAGDDELARAHGERADRRGEAERELQRALSSMARADEQIAQADALLGIPIDRPVALRDR